MTEMATIRWGDTQQFALPGAGVAISPTDPRFVTKQLVNANWRVPMSWNVILIAFPQFASGETATSLLVQWLFSVGSGAGNMTELPLFTSALTPVAGSYPVLQTQQLIPAQFMTIRARIVGTPLVSGDVLQLGAFVSPNNAEVFEAEAFQEAMQGHLNSEERRWMGRTIEDPSEAFREEQMYYQPARRHRHG